MVNAMVTELQIQKNYLNNECIETLYFGGGTPSLLTLGELDLIMQAIYKIYSLSSVPEITLEANPDDLTSNKLKGYKQLGVNRLSLGIQSFQDDILTFINRIHNANTAQSSYYDAREAGIENISIDLIYAIPGLDSNRWINDIERTIKLNPEHISCYSLTIEEKTVFGNWSASGKIKLVEDEVSAQQFELLSSHLQENEYQHYEISNFAKAGYHSRHNTSYWQQEKYLGIGPSAHSYNLSTRQFNVRNNHLYLKSIQQGIIPAEIEVLTRENKINEIILTTLRTMWGIDLIKLKKIHRFDLLKNRMEYLNYLQNKGLATITNNFLVLTQKGKLLADKIASDLFVHEL